MRSSLSFWSHTLQLLPTLRGTPTPGNECVRNDNVVVILLFRRIILRSYYRRRIFNSSVTSSITDNANCFIYNVWHRRREDLKKQKKIVNKIDQIKFLLYILRDCRNKNRHSPIPILPFSPSTSNTWSKSIGLFWSPLYRVIRDIYTTM